MIQISFSTVIQTMTIQYFNTLNAQVIATFQHSSTVHIKKKEQRKIGTSCLNI